MRTFASPVLTSREIVGSVVMPASIVPCLIAAMKVSPEPTAIGVNWSGVMPFVLARYCVRPCVPDPIEVTPSLRPLKSAGPLMSFAFVVATISASPGARRSWTTSTRFLPSPATSMVWSYEPDEPSTSLAMRAVVASLPDGSSMRFTVRF